MPRKRAGHAKPAAKPHTLGVRLEPDVRAIVELLAKRQKRSLNQQIAVLIEKALVADGLLDPSE